MIWLGDIGSGVSGEDTCEKHAMCWDLDPDTLTGTCIPMCTGSPDAPDCAEPDRSCTIHSDGVLTLCFPQCDPIAQDCPNGDLCIPNWGDPNVFICVLDASDEGQLHTPCEYANACDPGLYCVDPTLALECDQQALGCCLPFCDTDAPKKKKSKSRRDMRRANHDKRAAPTLVACPNCNERVRSHHVCPACGHYKGREVITIAQE